MDIKEFFVEILKKHNSYWKWKPGGKHVYKREDGKLTDTWLDCKVINSLVDDQDCFAEKLYWKWMELKNPLGAPITRQWPVSCGVDTIGLAQSIARHIGSGHGIRAAFTEVEYEFVHGRKIGNICLGRETKLNFDLGLKPYVILCTDVQDNGIDIRRTIKAILQKHPDAEFAPVVLCYVNMSGSDSLIWPEHITNQREKQSEFPIISITALRLRVWDEDGEWPEEMKQKCKHCQGTGKRDMVGIGALQDIYDCSACKTRGYITPKPTTDVSKLMEK